VALPRVRYQEHPNASRGAGEAAAERVIPKKGAHGGNMVSPMRRNRRQTIPDLTAYTAAWMRLSIWSFIRMFEMWFLTVLGLMCSSAAI
jgi:hypothetical protein